MYKCPECGSTDFSVSANVMIQINSDGEQTDSQDIEWDDSSYCYCASCDYAGMLREFEVDDAEDAEDANEFTVNLIINRGDGAVLLGVVHVYDPELDLQKLWDEFQTTQPEADDLFIEFLNERDGVHAERDENNDIDLSPR